MGSMLLLICCIIQSVGEGDALENVKVYTCIFLQINTITAETSGVTFQVEVAKRDSQKKVEGTCWCCGREFQGFLGFTEISYECKLQI